MNRIIESLPYVQLVVSTQRAIRQIHDTFEFTTSLSREFETTLRAMIAKKVSSGYGSTSQRLKRLFDSINYIAHDKGYLILNQDFRMLKFIIKESYRPEPNFDRVRDLFKSEISDEQAELILSQLPKKKNCISDFLARTYYTNCFPNAAPECSVCTDHIAFEQFVLLPCGHYHCSSCTSQLKHCSMCRAPIQ